MWTAASCRTDRSPRRSPRAGLLSWWICSTSSSTAVLPIGGYFLHKFEEAKSDEIGEPSSR
ncbi:unnamed protein product [Ectocarpus sp. 12 AP-2014]